MYLFTLFISDFESWQNATYTIFYCVSFLQLMARSLTLFQPWILKLVVHFQVVALWNPFTKEEIKDYKGPIRIKIRTSLTMMTGKSWLQKINFTYHDGLSTVNYYRWRNREKAIMIHCICNTHNAGRRCSKCPILYLLSETKLNYTLHIMARVN